MQQCSDGDQTAQIPVAGACVQNGTEPHTQGRSRMDSCREEEERSAQNNLAPNCGSRAEGDEPDMGRGTTCSSRQIPMEEDR